jgi:hypothetical protein
MAKKRKTRKSRAKPKQFRRFTEPYPIGTIIEEAGCTVLSTIEDGGSKKTILYLTRRSCCGVVVEETHQQIYAREKRLQTVCRQCNDRRGSGTNWAKYEPRRYDGETSAQRRRRLRLEALPRIRLTPPMPDAGWVPPVHSLALRPMDCPK